jgi:hypothetical protein
MQATHNPTSNIPADRLPAYVRDDERAIAALIVSELIAAGYALSVYDGEEFTVRRSQDAREVCGALATTDADVLLARMNGERAGSVTLIWGNGIDLLSDWASRATGEGVMFNAAVETLADTITNRYC